jgi:uncharacterized protein (TIGR03067 family)
METVIMKNRLRSLGLCCLVVVATSANLRADDLPKLQGTWKVSFAAVGEQTANDGQRKEMRIVIEGNKLTFHEVGGKKEVVYFRLLQGTAPKTIEFRQNAKQDAKLHYHGIYEMETAKRLKICWAPAEHEKPGAFGTKKANHHRYYILVK